MKSNEKELAEAPIGKLFVRLALPAVTAQMINVLYNLVDRMYIGHIPQVGSTALTGLGITMPIILAVSAFAALVSMGGAPRASIMMGKGERDEAEKILGTCTFTLIILSFVITIVILLFGKPILMAFGASDDTIPYALGYIRVYSLGTVFVQLALGLNSFITAQGYALTSMLTVTLGAVFNIILDPVFIFCFGMETEGAALATIISQAISCVWVIRFLCSKKSVLHLKRKYLCFMPRILLPCAALGFSPFLMQLTENIVAVCFNICVLKYGGDIAVGAVSIVCTVMNFAMLLLVGLTQGAQPILSFNLGAGNVLRIKKTFRLLIICCVVSSALIWALCMFFPGVVAGVFTDDPELISYTSWALKIFMCASAIFGIQVACQYSLVALNEAPTAIFLSIYRKILLLIPLIFILPNLFTDKTMAVFLAEPVADTLAVFTTAILFSIRLRKIIRKLNAQKSTNKFHS
ncbi:MAG: MATE family efflux transporter [Oscillospiraceae bacterium]